MATSITAAWVLTMMNGVQPNAPWKDTYEDTAIVIAEESNAHPLFAGDDGPAKTASYIVSLSWFESNLNPRAKGDCRKGGHAVKCTEEGAVPHSFCLGQINDTNFASLRVTADELVDSTRTCVRAMRAMAAQSMRICAVVYHDDAEAGLSWYTAGGEKCTKNDKSAHRVRKAKWLFAHYPVE